MSKYDKLWQYVSDRGEESFKLTYEEIEINLHFFCLYI